MRLRTSCVISGAGFSPEARLSRRCMAFAAGWIVRLSVQCYDGNCRGKLGVHGCMQAASASNRWDRQRARHRKDPQNLIESKACSRWRADTHEYKGFMSKAWFSARNAGALRGFLRAVILQEFVTQVCH